MLIRDAVKEDFRGITEIYNDVVLHSTAIFRETPITVEDALSLWRSRLDAISNHRSAAGEPDRGLRIFWNVPIITRLPLYG
jgi:L-amino acid N-acyltransferase YncA